jgi:hypothetical protein
MRLEPNKDQGWDVYRVKSLNTDNAAAIKAAPGVVAGWFIQNTTGTAIYVKLYDKSTAPDPASDVPRVTLQIPANGFISHPVGPVGMAFGTGIGILIVTGAADTDDTAVSAGACLASIAFL